MKEREWDTPFDSFEYIERQAVEERIFLPISVVVLTGIAIADLRKGLSTMGAALLLMALAGLIPIWKMWTSPTRFEVSDGRVRLFWRKRRGREFLIEELRWNRHSSLLAFLCGANELIVSSTGEVLYVWPELEEFEAFRAWFHQL